MKRSSNHKPSKSGDYRGGIFPLREEVQDCAGKVRIFVATCYFNGIGYTVRAQEEGKDGLGYEFAAYSETSPTSALGRVRQKMHRGLATRHITGRRGDRRMMHDTIAGRITCDENRGVILVVDGIPLDGGDLLRILESHEGWGFELRVTDSLQ